MNNSNQIISDATEKANMFNQYFSSVFTVDDGTLPAYNSSVFDPMPDFEFDHYDVLEAIKLLDPTLSSGPDKLPNYLFIKLATTLAKPLCTLFNILLANSVLPSNWLLAIITPIFKCGNKALVSDYQPISLTCVACKIFERILLSFILWHLANNNILLDHQHGFRKNRSTVTAMLSFVYDLINNIQQKNQTDCIFIDINKAFDLVSHTKLLSKLLNIGIIGNKCYN